MVGCAVLPESRTVHGPEATSLVCRRNRRKRMKRGASGEWCRVVNITDGILAGLARLACNNLAVGLGGIGWGAHDGETGISNINVQDKWEGVLPQFG